MRDKIKKITTIVLIGMSSVLVVSCTSGDTDGGKANDLAESYNNGTFVADDETVGRIEIDVLEPRLQVALTSGFFARAFDAAGAPVENIKIFCDSEEGVAILEPTTGAELTDSNGTISGKIGCEVPGSFQFGCRLPVGGNFRKFVSINCSGPIPNGFTGFPGAAGGGLGTGGTAGNQDGGIGGVNPEGVRITSISVSDTGDGVSTTSIDTFLSDCDEDPATYTPEPYFDTSATFTVVNNSNRTIRFTGLSYKVPNASGGGSSSFSSSTIGLIGEAAPNGGESTFSGILIFKVDDFGKKFQGASTVMPYDNLGFRNITFSLQGTTDTGEAVTISGTKALSFDNFSRCGS